MRRPTIDQYLVSTCLLIIDELNISYKGYTKEELKKEADEKFNEMDITVRMGYPFKQLVHYTVGESSKTKKEKKINHDLYIEQKDFKIEIKYLKNWKTPSNTWTATKTWSVFTPAGAMWRQVPARMASMRASCGRRNCFNKKINSNKSQK